MNTTSTGISVLRALGEANPLAHVPQLAVLAEKIVQASLGEDVLIDWGREGEPLEGARKELKRCHGLELGNHVAACVHRQKRDVLGVVLDVPAELGRRQGLAAQKFPPIRLLVLKQEGGGAIVDVEPGPPSAARRQAQAQGVDGGLRPPVLHVRVGVPVEDKNAGQLSSELFVYLTTQCERGEDHQLRENTSRRRIR